MLSESIKQELESTVKSIVSNGKGILAADESTPTIGKRFDNIKLENTPENRSEYRDLLFKTEGLSEYISGVILYEETLFGECPHGEKFTDVLHKAGIVPGIKVDEGLADIEGTDGEKYTKGLDTLDARCAKYHAAGARFAKWRCVITIDDKKPSTKAVEVTATTLADYASICQKNSLVPIIEPEILQDGDFSIERAGEEFEKVWRSCFMACGAKQVHLPGVLLKPNMVTPGINFKPIASPKDIAAATLNAMKNVVSPSVPGIVFLSGGASEEVATTCLNEMNKIKNKTPADYPWALSFSFGRALQTSCLAHWKGKSENRADAQEALKARAKANHEAAIGTYNGWAATDEAKKELFAANYVY